MVLNSAPPGVCPDLWWEWPRGQSGVKLEEREKMPSSPYNGQMCKSRTGEPMGPSHQIGSSWDPTMACTQLPPRAGAALAAWWDGISTPRLLLTRESLLSVWDFPGSVRSQEQLLRSVNRDLLNTHLVCARIWGNHHEQKPGSCPGGPHSPLER